MKALLFFILFFATFLWSNGQSYDIRLFDGRITKTKGQVQERLREYKRIRKEYTQYVKERKKQYRHLRDSTGSLDSLQWEVSKDSLMRLAKSKEDYFVYADSLYSLREIATWGKGKQEAKQRGVELIKEKLDGEQYLSRYRELKDRINSHKKTLKVYRDSLRAIDSLDREEVRYMVAQKKKELSGEYGGKLEAITRDMVNEKAPNLPEGFQSRELARFQEANAYLKNGMGDGGLAKLSRAQSTDHFRDKQEVLEKAQGEVEKLKKKYSEVNDLHDLSTAKKVGSLQDKPFKERLVFGGTFQLHVDRNTKVDLNPELSYRLNRNLEAGVGGTYRLTVASKELPQSMADPNVMGVRGFVEHKLIGNFYVHGEYEGLKSSIRMNSDRPLRDWHYSFLAGLERRFNLKGKFQGQAQVLYNFNSQHNPLYNSPWVFRVGFGIGGKE